jgi:hypothetical protein
MILLLDVIEQLLATFVYTRAALRRRVTENSVLRRMVIPEKVEVTARCKNWCIVELVGLYSSADKYHNDGKEKTEMNGASVTHTEVGDLLKRLFEDPEVKTYMENT